MLLVYIYKKNTAKVPLCIVPSISHGSPKAYNTYISILLLSYAIFLGGLKTNRQCITPTPIYGGDVRGPLLGYAIC